MPGNLADYEADATEPFQCLTLTVRVHSPWRVRLGLMFLRLAAWALKCGVKVETNQEGS